MFLAEVKQGNTVPFHFSSHSVDTNVFSLFGVLFFIFMCFICDFMV
jgi:hypothetical protein